MLDILDPPIPEMESGEKGDGSLGPHPGWHDLSRGNHWSEDDRLRDDRSDHSFHTAVGLLPSEMPPKKVAAVAGPCYS